jgi:hypothetical protein
VKKERTFYEKKRRKKLERKELLKKKKKIWMKIWKLKIKNEYFIFLKY